MNNQMKYGLAGIIIGGASVWLLTINAVNSSDEGVMRFMGMHRGNQSLMANTNIDAHFIEQMIPHHDDAISMAKLAKTNATTQEVKELADNIISSQGKENAQMRSWYKDWFGKNLKALETGNDQHTMMGGNGMAMRMAGQDNLQKLEQAVDFDKAFVEEMIPHHQMAVMMASMLKAGTQRPEMKKLAHEIITTQTKEIDEMRRWYRDWVY